MKLGKNKFVAQRLNASFTTNLKKRTDTIQKRYNHFCNFRTYSFRKHIY